MEKHRPIGITILAILAALGVIAALWHGLQLLGLLPSTLSTMFGDIQFFNQNLLGAVMWFIMAAIWAWVFRMLWDVDPRGWIFVTVLSFLNLVLALLAILGASDWQALLPAIVVNGAVLLYAMYPGTREAFEIDQMQASAAASAAPPPAAPSAPSEPSAPSAPSGGDGGDAAGGATSEGDGSAGG